MITNFNQYQLFEKSTLSKYIIDNNFINAFHKKFKGYVLKNPNIKKIDDFLDNIIDYISSVNYYRIIVIETKENFYILAKTGSINFDFYFYNKENKEIVKIQTSISRFSSDMIDTIKKNIIEPIIDTYLIYTDHNRNAAVDTVNFGKTLYFGKDSINDEIQSFFNQNYYTIFEKFYKNLYKKYDDKIIHIWSNYTKDNSENISENDKLKIQKLKEDLDTIKKLINKPFYRINLSVLVREIDRKLKNVGLHTGVYDIKISDEYFHQILNKLVVYVYYENNKYLNYKKQEMSDKLLQYSDELWKKLKVNIYDEDILKKYKHLIDAENFDII